MRDESQLQIRPKDGDSSLTLAKASSGLIARGRWDAAILPRPSPPAPIDPLSDTRRLAEQGNSVRQCWLGQAYDDGEGVLQDFAEAERWYRKAAEQGYGPAQQRLGRLYRDGRGVQQDFAEALRWYHKAASCEPYGDEALLEIGLSYYFGVGAEQDYVEAVNWFRKATTADSFGFAHLHLGYANANGHGVPQDYTEAVRLWTIAADGEELTDGHAHYMLGLAYHKGDGVPQDYILAYMWYALATEYGRTAEQKSLNKAARDRIAKVLTLQQLEEARRLAREWHAERFGPDSEIDMDS